MLCTQNKGGSSFRTVGSSWQEIEYIYHKHEGWASAETGSNLLPVPSSKWRTAIPSIQQDRSTPQWCGGRPLRSGMGSATHTELRGSRGDSALHSFVRQEKQEPKGSFENTVTFGNKRKIHNTGHNESETWVSLSWHCQLAIIPIISAGVVYAPWIQCCKADACVQSLCVHQIPPISTRQLSYLWQYSTFF